MANFFLGPMPFVASAENNTSCEVVSCALFDFFVSNQQHKINVFVNDHFAYLKSQFSKRNHEERRFLIYCFNNNIIEN